MITPMEKRLGFPAEASELFEREYAKIAHTDGAVSMLYEAQELYFDGKTEECDSLLCGISNKSGVHRYTLDMIFLLICLEPLKLIYRERGYSDELFYATVSDLTYKLYECHTVYGIWGTFVFSWYRRFFALDLFAHGRLQFERKALPISGYKDILEEGDTVYSCHIPSSGPLTPESVMDALKRAYAFFAPELKNGILPVYCDSWLLYPPHASLFPEGSNLARFYALFDVVESVADEKNFDFVRVFGTHFSHDTLSAVPADNTLRRNLKQYLLDGGCMGKGKAILLFDGEKIINR